MFQGKQDLSLHLICFGRKYLKRTQSQVRQNATHRKNSKSEWIWSLKRFWSICCLCVCKIIVLVVTLLVVILLLLKYAHLALMVTLVVIGSAAVVAVIAGAAHAAAAAPWVAESNAFGGLVVVGPGKQNRSNQNKHCWYSGCRLMGSQIMLSVK